MQAAIALVASLNADVRSRNIKLVCNMKCAELLALYCKQKSKC